MITKNTVRTKISINTMAKSKPAFKQKFLIEGILKPDMLYCGLFIASSPKLYFGNQDWYMECLCMVDPW
jgi:hypothetical protein